MVSFDPAAATISGDGVSPAASAAASGSPPGSAAATASADAGRASGPARGSAGSRARPRGSRSGISVDGVVDGSTRAARCSSSSVCASNGALAGEQLVEHQAERVEVALHRHLAPRQLLRRHVGRRAAADCRARRARSTRAASPKSVMRHLAAAVDHDVGRLEVAVQHALRRAPPPARRRAGARSRAPCPPAAGRCAAAATPGPRRRRTPSTGSAAPSASPMS